MQGAERRARFLDIIAVVFCERLQVGVELGALSAEAAECCSDFRAVFIEFRCGLVESSFPSASVSIRSFVTDLSVDIDTSLVSWHGSNLLPGCGSRRGR
jgi:hypothetical protein